MAVAEAVKCYEFLAVIACEFVEASGEVLVEFNINISHCYPPEP